MNIDKKYKHLLYDYKINPSQKPWERIEKALDSDKSKASGSWLVYAKWSAAASIALMITAYSIYQKVPMKADVANATIKQQDNVTDAAPKNETNKTMTIKPTDNQQLETNPIEKKVTYIQHNTDSPAIPYVVPAKTSVEQGHHNFEIEPQRNTFSIASLPMTNLSALPYKNQIIEPKNLPHITRLSPEEQRINKKWNQLVLEEINEEADSTITEKALFVANKKTVAFLQSNIKPTLINWFKLRKGF